MTLVGKNIYTKVVSL